MLTPEVVFRNYETAGVPDSGAHDPKKSEIIQLLNLLFGVSRGGWVVARTLAELTAITPPNATDGGVVLTGTGSGYYDRDGSAWVFGRGFPDTFAKVALSGSGTVQTGTVSAGVNPASIEVFFAKVVTPNSGALTLSVDGGAARQVVSLAGNPLAAGEWTGMVMFYLNDASQYQLLIDAGAASSAAASASAADAARAAAEAAAAGAGVTDGDKGGIIVSSAGTSWQTKDGAITEPKHATGGVSTRALADGASTADKLGVDLVPVLLSTAALQGATVRAAVKVLRVAGYVDAGDGGSHQRKRVAAQPAWGGIRSVDRFLPNGATDATNGGWWDVDEVRPNELMFGGVASRTNAQQTAAIQAMLDYCGSKATKATIATGHLITAGLVVPDYVTVEWLKRGYASGSNILDKVFNGDMIVMGNGSKLISPALRGNAPTWSGRGVVISTGSDQQIDDPYIAGMASYCLEFTTGGQGIRFRMNGGLIQSASGYAVRLPATEATTTGYRHFIGVHTGGTPFIDLRNGDYTIIDQCINAGISFGNTTTGRTKIINCRIADPAGVLIFGTEHMFAFNHCAGGVTIGTGATYCKVIGNILAGGVAPVNSSGNATNQIV